MLQVTTGWLEGMTAPSSRPTMISSSGSHSLCELTGETSRCAENSLEFAATSIFIALLRGGKIGRLLGAAASDTILRQSLGTQASLERTTNGSSSSDVRRDLGRTEKVTLGQRIAFGYGRRG